MLHFDHVIIVNQDRQYVGSVVVENDLIKEVREEREAKADDYAHLPCLLPGIIDEHVHFRDPGMTHKGDIFTESSAAAAGGVTTCFDMPNCIPQTTTIGAWEAKMARAAEVCAVNYALHFGATSDNASLFPRRKNNTKYSPH